MNEVKLQGRILNVFKGEKFSSFTLLTSGDEGHKSYPRVYVLNPELKEMFDKDFNSGDSVCVDAHIQTNREHPAHVVAYSIEQTKRAFEKDFGLKKGMFESDLNEVKIQGIMTHVYSPEREGTKISLVTIRAENEDGRVNYPVVTLFGRNASSVAQIPENTEVCFLGRMQTHRVEREDRMRYFESIVGSIVKA